MSELRDFEFSVSKRSRLGIRWVSRWLSVHADILSLSNTQGGRVKRHWTLPVQIMHEGPQTFSIEGLKFKTTDKSADGYLSRLGRRAGPLSVPTSAWGNAVQPEPAPPSTPPAVKTAFSPWMSDLLSRDPLRLARTQGRFARQATSLVRRLVDACMKHDDPLASGTFEGIRVRFAAEEGDYTTIAHSVRSMQALANRAEFEPTDCHPLLVARVDYCGLRAYCCALETPGFCEPSELAAETVASVLACDPVAVRKHCSFVRMQGTCVLMAAHPALQGKEWCTIAGRSLPRRVPAIDSLVTATVDSRIQVLARDWEEQKIRIWDSDGLRREMASHGVPCSALGILFKCLVRPENRALVACDAVGRAFKRVLRNAVIANKRIETLKNGFADMQDALQAPEATLTPMLQEEYCFGELNVSILPPAMVLACMQWHTGVTGSAIHPRVKVVSFRESVDKLGLSDSSPLQDKLRLEWAGFTGFGGLPPIPDESNLIKWTSVLSHGCCDGDSNVQWNLDSSNERVDIIAELMVRREDAIPELLLLFCEAEVVPSPIQPRILLAGAFAACSRAITNGASTEPLETTLFSFAKNELALLDGLQSLADAAWRSGQLERSITYLKRRHAIGSKALGMGHPAATACQSILGHALRKSGQFDAAIGEFDQIRIHACSRKDQPESDEAGVNLARTYRDMGETRKAMEAAATVIQLPYGGLWRTVSLAPDTPAAQTDALLIYGECCEILGRFTEAMAVFDTAWHHNPSLTARQALTRMALRKGFERFPDVFSKFRRVSQQVEGHSHHEKANNILTTQTQQLNELEEMFSEGAEPREIVDLALAAMGEKSDADNYLKALTFIVVLYFWANPDRPLLLGPEEQLVAHPRKNENTDSKNTTLADLRKLGSGAQLWGSMWYN